MVEARRPCRKGLSLTDTPRRLEHPSMNAPLLDWWMRDYDHVFVVLNPFFSVPGFAPDTAAWGPLRSEATTQQELEALIESLGDGQPNQPPDAFDEIIKTTGQPIRWDMVAQALGVADFEHFAHMVWLWVIGAEPPEADVTLISRIARHCRNEGLYKPEEDWLPLVVEPMLLPYFEALRLDEVTLWDETRTSSLECPIDAFHRDEPPVALMDAPISAISAPGMLLSWSQDQVTGLLAMTEEMRQKADPARFLEGFWAGTRTSSLVLDPTHARAPALLH
ncbi:CpsD/CapB family tyrosine-protein kinase [Yangia sp. PrR002]|nr:CpsD/CapB family tyrosine-protein kinase [Salipiger sp. PrR002]NDW56628.1 CpsD/CapB family tyrosine-protein kinase [Salipiger sp. PrR004]